MSFASLSSELTGTLPGLSPFLADSFINRAWRDHILFQHTTTTDGSFPFRRDADVLSLPDTPGQVTCPNTDETATS